MTRAVRMQCAWSKFEPRGFVISRGNLLELNRPSCNYAHARLIRHQKKWRFLTFLCLWIKILAFLHSFCSIGPSGILYHCQGGFGLWHFILFGQTSHCTCGLAQILHQANIPAVLYHLDQTWCYEIFTLLSCVFMACTHQITISVSK